MVYVAQGAALVPENLIFYMDDLPWLEPAAGTLR